MSESLQHSSRAVCGSLPYLLAGTLERVSKQRGSVYKS